MSNFEELGWRIDRKIDQFREWFCHSILRKPKKTISPELKALIDVTLEAHRDELMKSLTTKNAFFERLRCAK